MLVVDAGRVAYRPALRWQLALAAARSADEIDDVLLVVEHDPVYTAGRHADVRRNVLGTHDLPLVRTDRGGDVTYHGPGQVVIYPILRLQGPRRVRAYVGVLEEACILTAASYGVRAQGHRRRAGVWVGNDKLAAIGVRVQRGATTHGLAFNVDPDLAHYRGIVPCGISDAGVCSLASLGVHTTFADVAGRLVDNLSAGLRRPVRTATLAELGIDRHAAAHVGIPDVEPISR